MAVIMNSQPEAMSAGVFTEFTMSIGPGDWEPGPAPAAGDLVILNVIRPARPVVGPIGWTAVPGGRTFWKVWGTGEQYTATFNAAQAFEWEVKGYAVAAGSYSLDAA